MRTFEQLSKAFIRLKVRPKTVLLELSYRDFNYLKKEMEDQVVKMGHVYGLSWITWDKEGSETSVFSVKINGIEFKITKKDERDRQG